MSHSFTNNKTTAKNSPWHTGELAVQRIVGVVEQMAEIGPRALRTFMPEQHRDFYQQLPFIVAGVVDDQGYPWPTILSSDSGFISSPSNTQLTINAIAHPSDPASASFRKNAGIGFLGIELSTRRRNRVNGKITQIDEHSFNVEVLQTMCNCPKYIQLRDTQSYREANEKDNVKTTTSSKLSEQDISFINRTDYFYVASYKEELPTHQVDVSHRGGKPGFIKISQGSTLNIPDFFGNNFFNTLGNIHTNGKAGLLFIDDKSGDVLQLIGEARVEFDPAKVAGFSGAERMWTFEPIRIVKRSNALALRSTLKEMSPYSLIQGDWPLSEPVIDNEKNQWLTLTVSKVVQESAVIRSFYLSHNDESSLPSFQAGQHIPIRIKTSSGEHLNRHYTLSSAPSDEQYRISVKDDGLVSGHLHRNTKQGDRIEAKVARGKFILDLEHTRPIVMLAAGVGITPMISMIREMVAQSEQINNTDKNREIWLFQSAKTLAECAFASELAQLSHRYKGNIHSVATLSQATPEAMKQSNGQAVKYYQGRIGIELLKSVLPFDDFDFYLCGPANFMQDMYDDLRDLGIRNKRIFAEAFGPSSLIRDKTENTKIQKHKPASTEVTVNFATSKAQAIWHPEDSNLLTLAESTGLTPDFTCRSGDCGACSTKIIQGKVAYLKEPSYVTAANEALICCAVPASSTEETAQEALILAL